MIRRFRRIAARLRTQIYVLRVAWVAFLLEAAFAAETKLARDLVKAGMGYSALELDLRFWVKVGETAQMRLDVHRKAFREALGTVEEESTSPMDDPQFQADATRAAHAAAKDAVETLRALSLRKES